MTEIEIPTDADGGTPTPAHAYHAYLGPAVIEPLAEEVCGLAPPAPGAQVLDVACGTGILTRHLARAAGAGGHVVGVDLYPGMLAVATTIPTPAGAPIEWREGDGTALEVDDGSFEAVYCQQGLQYFPDRLAGAAELRRVLAPGGRAVVACWHGLHRHPLFAALADAEEEHLRAAGVALSRDELVAPFSLPPDELDGVLRAGGFSTVELVERCIEGRFADADRFVEHLEVAYAAVVPAFVEDPSAFRRFVDGVVAATADVVAAHRDGDEVVIPMHTAVALAR